MGRPLTTSGAGEVPDARYSLGTVTIEDVERARERIRPVIRRTRLIYTNALSRRLGGEIFLKPEMLQRTGSFKLRGAYNLIAGLSREERRRGVIAASAGNHAQGVAVAAQLAGAPATVVMPKNAPATKIEACRAYGADVILHGTHFGEAKELASTLQHERGLILVPGYDDERIVAGQGTIGLEILDELPTVDLVVVPVGGGGLIAGIAVAITARAPRARIVGIQAADAAAVVASLAAGAPVTLDLGPTLADGTAVERPGDLPFAIIQRDVDDVLTVSEAEIRQAMLALLSRAKLLAEGAGALALAAALSGRLDVAGKRVVLVLSGGNVDLDVLGEICLQGSRASQP
jgi:threonine dehydratase